MFNILLFNIIDPGFSSELLDVTINTAVVQLEAFGMSDEQISSAIEMMEAEANFNSTRSCHEHAKASTEPQQY